MLPLLDIEDGLKIGRSGAFKPYPSPSAVPDALALRVSCAPLLREGNPTPFDDADVTPPADSEGRACTAHSTALDQLTRCCKSRRSLSSA